MIDLKNKLYLPHQFILKFKLRKIFFMKPNYKNTFCTACGCYFNGNILFCIFSPPDTVNSHINFQIEIFYPLYFKNLNRTTLFLWLL